MCILYRKLSKKDPIKNPNDDDKMYGNKLKMIYKQIGIVHSPFKKTEGMPIQPPAGRGIEGKVTVFPEYAEGLADLDGFSHIHLIYHFHLSQGYSLKVTPFLDNKLRGVFATRAPRRPNQIGISIVRVTKMQDNIIHIMDIDIVNGTPLLDIKPYVPEFDMINVEKNGWYKGKEKESFTKRADNRFKQ
jgi:tRNA-Thr(GGU) m(6)t(6)A37 methyltransferase TsaA